MKTILIYWDDPKAKELAQEFRDMKHRAQIRNPRLFDGVCERGDIVCVESAAAAPHVVAAYQAQGVEVRDLSLLLGEIVAAEEAEAKASQPAGETQPPAETQPPTEPPQEAPKAPEPPADAPKPEGPKMTLAVTQPNTTPTRFTAMSDDELRAFINEAGKEIGVAAHPRAGRAKLLAQAELLDKKGE